MLINQALSRYSNVKTHMLLTDDEVLNPSDFPFAKDRIAAETDTNTAMVAIADLSMSDLIKSGNNGTVGNLKNRRHDFFSVSSKGN